MVVAIPLARPVERHDEAVRAREPREHLRRPRRLEHGVAQTAAHAIQHRGVHEELRLVRRQPDRSSRRKYSDTNRSSPVKTSTPPTAAPRPAATAQRGTGPPASPPSARSARRPGSASSSTPTASSSSPASCSSSRRSDTPISCTHPCARQRASGSAGASRLVTAICEPAGTYRTSSARTSRQDGCRRGGDRRAPARSAARRAAIAAPTAGRSSSRRTARAGQRIEDLGETGPTREAPPRCTAGTPGVVVPPVERHPGERTRVALGPSGEKRRLAVPGRRDHGRQTCVAALSRAITSTFATVPGRIDGGASLTSTRSKGTSATATARRC